MSSTASWSRRISRRAPKRRGVSLVAWPRCQAAELILSDVLTETPVYGKGPFSMGTVRHVYEVARKWAEGALEEWVAKARSEGLSARAALRTGTAYAEIVNLARDERAGLIVIGTHGRGGVGRVLLGSVADRVVRLAPCPVLTVREPA